MTDSHAAMAEKIVRLTRELHKANIAGARVTEAYKALGDRESLGHRDATTDSYDVADWPYPPEWDAQQEYVESLEREGVELRKRAGKAEADFAAFQEESETHAALNDMVRQRDEAQRALHTMTNQESNAVRARNTAERSLADALALLENAQAEGNEAVAGQVAMVKVVRNCVEKLRTDPYYRQNGIIIQNILGNALEKSRPEAGRIFRIAKAAEEETEAEDDKSATRDVHWAIRGDERTEADFERVKKADNRAVESREARRKAVRREDE